MKLCVVCGKEISDKSECGKCRKCYYKKWREANYDHCQKYDRTIERRFKMAQHAAKKRGIEWQLSIEEFTEIADKPCSYCENTLGEKVVTRAGLDRLDNSKGYIAGNIIPCCETCNSIRNKYLTVDEMMAVAKLIRKLRNI